MSNIIRCQQCGKDVAEVASGVMRNGRSCDDGEFVSRWRPVTGADFTVSCRACGGPPEELTDFIDQTDDEPGTWREYDDLSFMEPKKKEPTE
ncbi:MAG: hypothetical protein GY838_13015 [bacterium]|nr:hypothetical protein [bacterium]